MTYSLECVPCEHYGEAVTRDRAEELVALHNEQAHDGEDVATLEADR